MRLLLQCATLALVGFCFFTSPSTAAPVAPIQTVRFSHATFFAPPISIRSVARLQRTGDLSQPTSVEVRVAGGTAIEGIHFRARTNVARFEAGAAETILSWELLPTPGTSPTPTDSPTLELEIVDPANPASPSPAPETRTTLRILPQPIRLFWTDPNSEVLIFEPQAAALSIRRVGALDIPLTLRARSIDGTARGGVQFEAIDRELVLPSNSDTASFEVRLINDGVNWANTTLQVRIENTTSNVFGILPIARSVRIVDNDTGYGVGGNPLAGTPEIDPEGIRVTVYRYGDFGSSKLHYRVIEGTAKEGVDFVATSGTLEFGSAPYETREIIIPLIEDELEEKTETLTLELTNPTPVIPFEGGVVRRRLYIADSAPGFRFASPFGGQMIVSTPESSEPLSVTIRRIGFSQIAASVEVASVDGTAKAGKDYERVVQTLQFAPGEMAKTIQVRITPDRRPEYTEDFHLRLREATAGIPIATTNLTVQIEGNDPGIHFASGASLTVSEAQRSVRIVVQAPPGLTDSVRIRFRTRDGTARAGLDYLAVSGELEFGPGIEQQTIGVPLLNDGLAEDQESFQVEIEGPSDENWIAEPTLSVEIADNETGYEIQQLGGLREAGGGNAVRLLLGGDYNVPSAVSYRIVPGTNPDYAAVPGRHFTPISATVTFAPGESSKDIPLDLPDNSFEDGARQIRIELFNPTGGIPIRFPSLEVGIGDDDLGYLPADNNDGSWYGALAVEEQEGVVQLHLRRVGSYQTASTVDYEVAVPADPTENAAVPGRDFDPTQGTLTFAANQNEATIPVQLHATPGPDPDRVFEVRLSNFRGAVGRGYYGLVLIRDTDPLPARVDPDYGADLDQDLLKLAVAPDGAAIGFQMGDFGGARWVRILPDGRLDPAFPTRPAGDEYYAAVALPQGGMIWPDPEVGLSRIHPDGRFERGFGGTAFRGQIAHTPVPRAGGGFFARTEDGHWLALKEDGSRDETFAPLREDGAYRAISRIDGGLILLGSEIRLDGIRFSGAASVGPDSKPDPTFRIDPSLLDVLQDLWALSNGRYLAQVAFPPPQQGWVGLTANGALDPEFTPIRGNPRSILVEADGFWITRWSLGGSNPQRLEHYLLDGTPDPRTPPQRLDLRSGRSRGHWRGMAADARGGLYLAALSLNGHYPGGLARIETRAPMNRLELGSDDVRLGENLGETTVTVLRGGDTSQPRIVKWRTRDDSAKAGVDYEAASGELRFAPGQRATTARLRLLDNDRLDAERLFFLRFESDGTPALPDLQVTVVNDDPGFLPPTAASIEGNSLKVRPTGHRGRRGFPGGGVFQQTDRIDGGVSHEDALEPWSTTVHVFLEPWAVPQTFLRWYQP